MNLPAGINHYFTVTALEDHVGPDAYLGIFESAISNEVIRSISSDEIATEAPPAFTCIKLFIGKVYCHWNDVELNEDQTPVTDLLKYRIYYGANRNAPEHYVDVESGTDFVFEDLPIGEQNWFKVVALDASLNQSVYSTEFTEKVNAHRKTRASAGIR